MEILIKQIKKLFAKIFRRTFVCSLCGKTCIRPSAFRRVTVEKFGYYDESVREDIYEICNDCYEEYGAVIPADRKGN